MWTNALFGLAAASGAWNLLGALLGVIWLIGIGIATVAWLTLPAHRCRHGAQHDEPLPHHGND